MRDKPADVVGHRDEEAGQFGRRWRPIRRLPVRVPLAPERRRVCPNALAETFVQRGKPLRSVQVVKTEARKPERNV